MKYCTKKTEIKLQIVLDSSPDLQNLLRSLYQKGLIRLSNLPKIMAPFLVNGDQYSFLSGTPESKKRLFEGFSFDLAGLKSSFKTN